MAPFSVLIRLGTFASALAVVVVLLSMALPEFRSAIEGPSADSEQDVWAEAHTEQGERYYYHVVTGETAWERHSVL